MFIKGCKLREWNDFVRYSWHVLYDKMVYRKLIFKVENDKKIAFMKEFEENLSEFLKVILNFKTRLQKENHID